MIRRLVDEVGVERMRLVLSAAHDHRIAYAGRPASEASPLGATTTDWRGFLDLLEQVAGSQQAENLFSTWVVTPAQRSQLTAHGQALAAYAQLVAHGRGWLPGYVVRYPLAAWQFPAAQTAITDAQALLDQRDTLDGLAQTLGLAAPDALQRAYEEAAIDFTAAHGVAARERDALEGIRDGRAAVAAEHDVFTLVGLFGSTPQTELDAAADAFSAADFEAAQAHTATALATVNEAADPGPDARRGRGRGGGAQPRPRRRDAVRAASAAAPGTRAAAHPSHRGSLVPDRRGCAHRILRAGCRWRGAGGRRGTGR